MCEGMPMKKLLYIIANPNPSDLSYSRKVADFIVSEYQALHPDHRVVVKDLYKSGVPLLDESYLSGRRKQALGEGSSMIEVEQKAVQAVEACVDEFLDFDRYLIAVPMWNFGVPPLLKAYVDTLLVPGKTFSYKATGPVGLLAESHRKMIVVESTGGIYSQGPAAKLNHCSTYLQDVFGFIGIEQLKILPVEGTAIPGHNETVVEKAKKAAQLALSEF
jgi:FMN-dependent NADH-azoreductase